jgi:bacterioferritin
MADQPFVTDIQTLRARARQHIERGAVTPGYRANRETVIKLLNEALATEIVCVLRYKRHFFMATGINAQSVAQEFLQHANGSLNASYSSAESPIFLPMASRPEVIPSMWKGSHSST